MNSNFQTNYSNGDKIFFTSDTHFGHANIIEFAKRPFSSVEEMDEALIKNWNERVPKDGLVFHLGDFSFGRHSCEKYLKRLNGKIVLIVGNHDFKNLSNKDLDMFYWHSQQLFIKIENRKLFLNHFPFLCYSGSWRNQENAVWQLFGHVHSGPLSKCGKDLPRLSMLFPYQYDVGVDNNDFIPISWNEVKEKINAQSNI